MRHRYRRERPGDLLSWFPARLRRLDAPEASWLSLLLSGRAPAAWTRRGLFKLNYIVLSQIQVYVPLSKHVKLPIDKLQTIARIRASTPHEFSSID